MNNTAKNLIIAFVLLNLVVFGAVLYFQRAERSTTQQQAGGAAPGFTLPQVGAPQMVSLEDHRGKVVLLDFWATWCPPCRKQMPAVQNLEEDPSLEDQLKIVSVNADEGPNRTAKVEKYLKEHDYTFTTVLDDGRASSQYGISRLPTLVVITPGGEISHVETGVHSESDLRELIAEAKRAKTE